MTTPRPSLGTFTEALSTGLFWGVGAATLIAVGVMALGMISSDGVVKVTPDLVVVIVLWTAVVAMGLALFPIGPIAWFAGWQLYRRGVVAGWAYAAVGAVSALVAPLLFTALFVQKPPFTGDGNVAVINDIAGLLAIAAFPIVGAFAGFMAARALRKLSASYGFRL